ncbi:hypothetical protein CP978_30330 [Streptomyces nodosus]|uniref:Uncharacterized protein n=2 Tax=Streptomyces nodosus TaxID=40318 RepID=A0A0B5DUF0_9ACTN|nr:hypothetical protein SNOD_30020 [Streptomyces nodosus]QEV42279.1 hypothetical protein CP978_30330 [Streptomyces nodosus]
MLVVLFAGRELYALRRVPRRSVLREFTSDRVALYTAALWWACSTVVIWTDEHDWIGAPLFGILTACMVGTAVAQARRVLHRQRDARAVR